jgi:hypothetical protein
MSSQHANQAQPAASLPVLSTGVIRRYRTAAPTFDLLLRRLHRADPAAARWLYSAAEHVAPADVVEKERYATLALGLYYMLSEQKFVDELSRLYSSPLRVMTEMPLILELGTGDTPTDQAREHVTPLEE